jgi:hypothetical protein
MASSTSTTYTVIAHYSDASGFLNSLTPTCTVRTQDGTIVASGTMTLIADGDYKLTFSGQTNTQYLWQADAGASLPHSIRYVGNSFKENVISSVEIRDALLENPTSGLAASKDSIDNKLRILALLVDQILKKLGIKKNDYR